MQLVYLNPDTWLANVDKKVLVVKQDRISAALPIPDRHVWLTCGKNSQPIAFSTEGHVFSYEEGNLLLLSSPPPEHLRFADGKTIYWSTSLDAYNGEHAIFVGSGGKSREIARGHHLATAADNHFYLEDKSGFSIYQDGKPISRVNFPQGAKAINLLWRGALMECRNGQDGIYSTDVAGTYIVRSRFGEQRLHLSGAMRQTETRQRCGEYVLIQQSAEGNSLWSLTPGKKLDLHRIPTRCDAASFSLNDDGSIHYRCGKQFRYLNATRTEDVPLGEISPPYEGAALDRWLVTSAYGTLYANSTEPSPDKPVPQICFARFLRDKLIRIGCTASRP